MKSKTILWLLGATILIVFYGFFDPATYAFPPCPMRTLTGWLCPGCGSQRAIHQAIHGNFSESFRLNSLFLPAISYGLFGLMALHFFPAQWPLIRNKIYGLKAACIALAIIIMFWIGRNIF